MTLDQLLNRLEALGIERPSVLPVSEVTDYESIYEKRRLENKLSGFEPNVFEKASVRQHLAPWQTIIGLAVPYVLSAPKTPVGLHTISQISIMAWEWDYHQEIKKMLESVLEDAGEYAIHVDSGPLPERSIALKMGIAKAGRSQLLIHPKYGTGFYLAFILTNMQPSSAVFDRINHEGTQDSTFTLADSCKHCRRCQNSCPSGALTGESDFDGTRCISALTQKKGPLNDWEKKSIGCQLYGCDICQIACPANQAQNRLELTHLKFPVYRQTINQIDPRELLTLSQKAFLRTYGHMGFAWRGVKTMKRNALINMGNSRDVYWVDVLKAYINSRGSQDDAELIEAAQWALTQLGAV